MTLLHNFVQRYDFSGRQRNDNKLKRVNFYSLLVRGEVTLEGEKQKDKRSKAT